MQRVSALMGRMGFGDSQPVPSAATVQRRELWFGISGMIIGLVGFIVLGVLYLVPFGKTTYSAEIAEAGSVKVGDPVRVAGVPAGKVTDLILQDDHVDMKFTVDSDIFIGDATSLEIRMLIAIGGHYVMVFPAGAEPLGDKVIPRDRVQLPYSLIEAFQDATTPLEKVDSVTLRKNFAAMNDMISSNPQGLRSMGGAVMSLTELLDEQNAQISGAIDVADQYTTVLNEVKSRAGQLVADLNNVETTLITYRIEMREAVELLERLLSRIHAILPVIEERIEPILAALSGILPTLRSTVDRLDNTIWTLDGMATEASSMISPDGTFTIDQSDQTVPLNRICIPMPGKEC